MIRKLAGLEVKQDDETGTCSKELYLLVICKCGFYIFDDPVIDTCPRPECGQPKSSGRIRARKMVLVNIVERLRTLFAKPATAKYLAYAAERDGNGAADVYRGDLWDNHRRLKIMDTEVYISNYITTAILCTMLLHACLLL